MANTSSKRKYLDKLFAVMSNDLHTRTSGEIILLSLPDDVKITEVAEGALFDLIAEGVSIKALIKMSYQLQEKDPLEILVQKYQISRNIQ